MSKRDKVNPIMQLVVFTFAVLLLFFLAPGMAILAISRQLLSLNLDIGQMWTFSVVISAIIFALIFHIRKSFIDASTTHIVIALVIVGLYLISFFGLKADFPKHHLNLFFNQTVEVSKKSMTSQIQREEKSKSAIIKDEGIFRGISQGDYYYVNITDNNGIEHGFMILEGFVGQKDIDFENPMKQAGKKCRFTWMRQKNFIPEAGEELEREKLISFAWID
ncbi:MAG TPA: hypothetical protein VK186_00290 [Candidatus Deferrimicrobium sp.]|nr:hypothetical protein [Candidatus Deferrimicrobium sp.]